ncbi:MULTISPECIES: ferredoxin [Halobacteriovorax]|uniref:Ferredoxin n=1 Tax=Halobacteriovorax vibrionivorans TaxID=2152716 RepID=A0ABY0IH50_9BACT|nr:MULTISPECIES: ferredoxin [Halobacteriovorax]AYF43516.1 ferredoxin family protein [Halobacteriovorax sp. BALOs_7]RZF21915.1 ferredoxin [Halobacteriovorax vibrionivorans]TGD45895.1 ferredoxin [Halobacteriovorax sp. Y22]
MADKSAKFDQNVDGKFYVDDQCIACDACVMEAPRFFEMNDDEGHAFVKLQPTNDAELEECISALEACPVEAIGDDG